MPACLSVLCGAFSQDLRIESAIDPDHDDDMKQNINPKGTTNSLVRDTRTVSSYHSRGERQKEGILNLTTTTTRVIVVLHRSLKSNRKYGTNHELNECCFCRMYTNKQKRFETMTLVSKRRKNKWDRKANLYWLSVMRLLVVKCGVFLFALARTHTCLIFFAGSTKPTVFYFFLCCYANQKNLSQLLLLLLLLLLRYILLRPIIFCRVYYNVYKVSPSGWLFVIFVVGFLWIGNHYLIIRRFNERLQLRRRIRNRHNDNDNDQELDGTYDMIYRPIWTASEELKTWIWLILALLLNISMITIEMSFFQELAQAEEEEEQMGYTNNNTTVAHLRHNHNTSTPHYKIHDLGNDYGWWKVWLWMVKNILNVERILFFLKRMKKKNSRKHWPSLT